MSPKPSISGRAEADLTHQYRWYLENGGVSLAERFLTAFDSTIERLGRNPELGRRRRFRDPKLTGLRSLGVGGRFGVHVVFYRTSEEGVFIDRIMHGARNLPTRLLEAPENDPPTS